MISYAKKYINIFINLYRQVMYKGDEVICTVCSWQGSRFFSSRCPSCNSLPRTRLIPYLFQFLNINLNEKSVLHIAPNRQEYNIVRNHFTPFVYDCLDLYPRKEIINLVQDIRNLSMPSFVYDFIISWHVMEHIPEDYLAIREMYRVLKPGGQLLLSVPIYPINRKKTFEDSQLPRSSFSEIHGHPDHCRSCGLDYYLRFVKEGFTARTIEVKNFDLTAQIKFGLKEGHVVWLLTKGG